MSKLKEQLGTKQSGTNANETNNLDYSKGELKFKNIVIPRSEFMAKYIDGEGYAIGIENIKITKSYKTLDEALGQIGYGVDVDEDGDEVLVKSGEFDYEIVVRIVRALVILNEENRKLNEVKDEQNEQENN